MPWPSRRRSWTSSSARWANRRSNFIANLPAKFIQPKNCGALILKKLKLDAEKYLKQPITDAVITVPAYFNDAERTATITRRSARRFQCFTNYQRAHGRALAYGLG